MELAKKVTDYTEKYSKKLKIAVMGCVVNGPGEAKDCDLGIAGGKEYCIILQRGKEAERVNAAQAEQVFFERLERLLHEE